jgi:phosphoglycolate phosphatase
MKDLRAIDAIAFDLDGTLVDSAPDIAAALDGALAAAGLRRHDVAAVRRWIGDGPDVLIGRALADQGLGDSTDELRSRLRRHFDAATLAEPLARGAVFRGIAELLERIHGRLPTAVVTNKPTRLASAVVGAAGLYGHLDHVLGADRAELRKPAPALLLEAARRLGVDPGELLMVGDSGADLLCARAAGCPAVLVGWGYGSAALPAGLEPWRVDDPADLLHALEHAQTAEARRAHRVLADSRSAPC